LQHSNSFIIIIINENDETLNWWDYIKTEENDYATPYIPIKNISEN